MGRRVLWTCALTLAVGGVGGMPAEAREGPSDAERVVRIVRDLGHQPARATRELAALGPDAAPSLLIALEAGRASDGSGDGVPLGAEGREIVLGSLERLGRRAVVAGLEQVASDGRPLPRATLLAMERVGRASDLEVVLDACADGGAGGLSTMLERCVLGILERDREAFGAVRTEIRRGSAAQAMPLVRALSLAGDPRGQEVLASLLGTDRALDPIVLSQLGRVESGPAPDALRRRVRTYLREQDVELARAATLAIGRLEDWDGAEELIELLESGSPKLRDAASWSLRDLSGIELPADAGRWRAWLDSERRWFRARHDALVDELANGERSVAIAASTEVARHRYRRADLARAVLRAARRQDPEIARHACGTLATLGAPAVVPDLVRLLDFADAPVRDALQDALRRLTGHDAPPDSEGWERVLASGAIR